MNLLNKLAAITFTSLIAIAFTSVIIGYCIVIIKTSVECYEMITIDNRGEFNILYIITGLGIIVMLYFLFNLKKIISSVLYI